MTSSANPVHNSVMFRAPGRPLPLARRLAVHNRVRRAIRDVLEQRQFNEVPAPQLTAISNVCEETDAIMAVDHCGDLALCGQGGQLFLERMIARGFPAVWCEGTFLRREWKADERHLTAFTVIEAERQDLDLDGLCELQGALLRAAIADLGADLLGGRNVTRLDRVMHTDIPRLSYREALDVLNGRGWAMPFGEDLHRDAEATLTRYCSGMPVIVTRFPATLKPFNTRLATDDSTVCESAELILPQAGETMDGGVRETDGDRLQARLDTDPVLRNLARAARQVAATAVDPASARDRYTQGGLQAYGDHIAVVSAHPVPRAGTTLGLARLLQYVMGLETICDAVVAPVNSVTFRRPGSSWASLASRSGLA